MSESDRRKLHTASEGEIRTIIEKMASESVTGYLFDSQVKRRLEALRIEIKSSNYRAILDTIFHEDRFGPRIIGESLFPRRISDRVKQPSAGPMIKGAPNLGLPTVSRIIDGTYRHGAKGTGTTGGISRAKPKDLRSK